MKRILDSVIEIECKVVKGKDYFHRFCALGPCTEGFWRGCRPWLGVDATTLNGRWNGHLAAATGVDGHNWMYPVAYGFMDSETKDNWKWWMSQLHKVVGDLPKLSICSHAYKGLLNAVRDVFLEADRRECFRHLMQNFVKRFLGESGGHMWPAARAYDRDVYESHMTEVYAAFSSVKSWLETHHKLKWQISNFDPDIKCDYVTSNVAEILTIGSKI
jgi:transposase-like protein